MENTTLLQEVKCHGPAITIDCMSQKLAEIPDPPRIFRGIIEPSLGCFFGPSKSGKTTLVENLAFSIASGRQEFLGDAISCENKRVLLVSLEEYYRSRTIRNQKQISAYNTTYSLDSYWTENIFVIDDTFPRYLITEEHWTMLEKVIERVQPSMVMIDSLTRLTIDSIEDSSVASKLMKRLREIAHRHGIALVLIHHSQKMDNRPVTISTLAGSRVVGQELDFMIGVNRTTQNIRYVKDVAYRYWPDDNEHVMKFSIGPDQMIEPLGNAYEHEILSIADSANSTFDSDIIVQNQFMELVAADPSIVVKTSVLYDRLITPGLISRPTLHAALKRLEAKGVITKPEKGCYILTSG